MIDSPQTRRKVLAAFVVGLVALAIALTVGYIAKATKPDRNDDYTKTAFLRWRLQVHDLHQNIDIYQKHNYPNPPIMALVLTPFMELPPLTGALIWFFLKFGMAVATALIAFRLVVPPGSRYPLYGAMAATLLALHPIAADLSHGNVNIFIGFLVFICFELFRRRFDYASGVVLALAIACKVTPFLLVPYFGWKMTWSFITQRTLKAAWDGGGKVLAGCVVGLGLWLFAVPGAILGQQRNAELLESWFTTMAKPFLVEGKATAEHINQSIPGIAFRLFTHSPSVIAYDKATGAPQPENDRYHTLVDLGPSGAKWIIRSFQALFVLAVVLLMHANVANSPRQGLALAAELSFILLGMLLFSERTWKHHATTLILPFAVLVWAYLHSGPKLKAYLLTTFIACLLLMFGPSAGGKLQDEALAYGSYTLVFLLLIVAVGVVMKCAVASERKSG